VADLSPILGLLGGAVGIVDTLPYVRDTLCDDRHPGHPHRTGVPVGDPPRRGRPERGRPLATAAVGELDVSLVLYPAYYCVVNSAIALLIHWRRRKISWSPPRCASGEVGRPSLAVSDTRGRT
jgi:hypothetical protein